MASRILCLIVLLLEIRGLSISLILIFIVVSSSIMVQAATSGASA